MSGKITVLGIMTNIAHDRQTLVTKCLWMHSGGGFEIAVNKEKYVGPLPKMNSGKN